MLKTEVGFFLILVIFAIIVIASSPVCTAGQYGTVLGHALDRNGNGIKGVTVTLKNGDNIAVASTVTDAGGRYSFSHVPADPGSNIFKVTASFTASGRSLASESAYFYSLPLQPATQDVRFDDYPPTGMGGLYGVVSSDPGFITPEPATVYFDNGMFLIYPGGPYDEWAFNDLPQGTYTVWAERNIGNFTYKSDMHPATVTTDEQGYVFIFLPTNKPAAYRQQPAPMKNVVHGTVLETNGLPSSGASVSLYRISGSSREPVASTITNDTGQYLFNDVYVNGISATYVVEATFEVDGVLHAQDSAQFTVYYANTLGVSHDYDATVYLPFIISGSAAVQTVPAGARVYIDGMDTGHVTPYTAHMKAGTRTLKLTLDGYVDDSVTLLVQPGTALGFTRTLKPGTGNLSLEVNPASAQVFFDGSYIGTGPAELTKKPVGEHTYLIVCDGYANESGTVTVVPGQSVTMDVDMVATPGFSLNYIAYLIDSMFRAIGSIF